jgi:hypothetical protein
MEETSTNVYLQSPFSHLTTEDQEGGFIYLTGDSNSSLIRAKDLLKKLTAQKVKLSTCLRLHLKAKFYFIPGKINAP